jgi:sulfopyruvate decarboxylase subunit beta
VIECSAENTGTVLQEALDSGQMTIIVCKCESGNAKMPVITMDPVTIRDRFMSAIEA